METQSVEQFYQIPVLRVHNLQGISDSISYRTPFDIIETLGTISSDDLNNFVESLRDVKNQPTLSQMIYFQKYFERYMPEVARRVEAIAIGNHRRHNESGGNIPYALARYTSDEQRIITENLAYVQATNGCGGDCIRGCGVDAVPRVRDRIPAEHILWTLEKVAEHKDRKKFLRLYFASDPLELTSEPGDLFLIAQTYFNLFNKPLDVVTSVPKGTEDIYKEICRRKIPSINLCLSITEQNIERLHAQGILRHGSLESLALWPGNNPRIYPGTFQEEYTPQSTNLITEEFRENVGINRYNIHLGIKRFWNRTALLMTPYGILNTIAISRVDKHYPQGRIVVSVDRLSDKPFDLREGAPIDSYLTDCIVSYSNAQESPNKSFYLSNLSGIARVIIDEEEKILLCDTRVSKKDD